MGTDGFHFIFYFENNCRIFINLNYYLAIFVQKQRRKMTRNTSTRRIPKWPKMTVTETVHVTLTITQNGRFSFRIEPFLGLFYVNCLCHSLFGPFWGRPYSLK